MVFIAYSACGTCRKAREWLDAHALVYTDRPIKEQPPTVDELRAWRQRSGLPLRRFFNTSGKIYQALGLKDRLPTMDEAEQLRLLAGNAMLIRRPLLVTDDAVLVGFRAAEWEEALL